MANITYENYTTGLAPAGTQNGTELIPVVQSGSPVKMSLQAITATTRTAAEIAAGVTPTNYAYPPGDARRYGAKGDASTDDTTALQNWVKANSTVYLPKQAGAYYKISAAITLPSNVVVYGDGFQSQIRQTTNNTDIFTTVLGTQNIVIRDMGLYDAEGTAGAHGCIHLVDSSYVTVERCQFQNMSFSGVLVGYGTSTSWNVGHVIRQNQFVAWNATNIQSDCAAVHLLDLAQECWVEDNYIVGVLPTGANAVSSPWHGIMVQNTNSSAYSMKHTIRNNYIANVQTYGIICYRVALTGTIGFCDIEGNWIENVYGANLTGESGAGIYSQGCSMQRISNNRFYNTNIATTAYGLAPGAIGINAINGDHTITGNTIDSPNWNGIYCVSQAVAGAQTTITGNTINNVASNANGTGGIQLKDHGFTSITGNKITSLGGANPPRGILCAPSVTGVQSRLTISGNDVQGAGSAPLEVDYYNDVTVSGNNIISSTGTGALSGFVFTHCNRVTVNGNNVNMGAATSPALTLGNTTLAMVAGNQFVNGGGTSQVFNSTGTCTGSVVDRSNQWSGVVFSNGGTGCNVSYNTSSGSPAGGTGSAQVGDAAWSNTGATPLMYWCSVAGAPGTWISLSIP